jgi:hypothetical protein
VAKVEEMMALPGIGKVSATRILEEMQKKWMMNRFMMELCVNADETENLESKGMIVFEEPQGATGETKENVIQKKKPNNCWHSRYSKPRRV